MDTNGHTSLSEEYCSYEVAKLLKDKGFDYQGFDYIDFEGEVIRQDRPTHQMAMKWLREVHKIGIFPSTYTFTNVGGTEEYHPYGTAIINLVTYELMTDDIMARSSYEEAVEAALKYALENLI